MSEYDISKLPAANWNKALSFPYWHPVSFAFRLDGHEPPDPRDPNYYAHYLDDDEYGDPTSAQVKLNSICSAKDSGALPFLEQRDETDSEFRIDKAAAVKWALAEGFEIPSRVLRALDVSEGPTEEPTAVQEEKPRPGKSGPKYPTHPGTVWRDVKLTIQADKLSFTVSARQQSPEKFTYHDLAVKKRPKAPSAQWFLLLFLAERKKLPAPPDKRETKNLREKVRRLNKDFAKIFSIDDGLPIGYDRSERVWSANFDLNLDK